MSKNLTSISNAFVLPGGRIYVDNNGLNDYLGEEGMYFNGTPRTTVVFVPGAVGPPGLGGAPGKTFPTRGPMGPTGPTGIKGATGQPGPTGNTGTPGSRGPRGPTGATGNPGATGMVGQMGTTGSIGPVGPKGPTGVGGPTGPTGATGTIGPTGGIGPMGLPGMPGPTGILGPTGFGAGPVGPTGPVGPFIAGPTGPTGPPSGNGPTGPAGPVGAVGATGLAGPTGPTGAVGPTGTTGPFGYRLQEQTRFMFELYEEYQGPPSEYLFFSQLGNPVAVTEQTEHSSVYSVTLNGANPNAVVGYRGDAGFMAASGDQMFSITMQINGAGWFSPTTNGYFQVRRYRSLNTNDEVRLRANIVSGAVSTWRLQWVVGGVVESDIDTGIAAAPGYNNLRLKYPATNASVQLWNAGVFVYNLAGTPLPDGTTDSDFMVHRLEAMVTGLPSDSFLQIDRVYFNLWRAMKTTSFP